MVGLERKMVWVFLEVALVLAIALGIVWWTMPKTSKPKEGAGPPADKDPPPRD